MQFLELSLQLGSSVRGESCDFQNQRMLPDVARSGVDLDNTVRIHVPRNLTQGQHQIIGRTVEPLRSIDAFHLSQGNADDQRR